MEYLIGKKVEFKWKEEIIKGYDVASYSEYIIHEEKGVIQQFLFNNKNELLILFSTKENKLKTIFVEKIYALRLIEKPNFNIELKENKFKLLDL